MRVNVSRYARVISQFLTRRSDVCENMALKQCFYILLTLIFVVVSFRLSITFGNILIDHQITIGNCDKIYDDQGAAFVVCSTKRENEKKNENSSEIVISDRLSPTAVRLFTSLVVISTISCLLFLSILVPMITDNFCTCWKNAYVIVND